MIHVCWFIVSFFMVFFLCHPVSKWWDVAGTQPEYCIDGYAFLVVEEAINSSLDFAIITLTVVVGRKLATSSYVKAKLALVFIVGGLSDAVGFVKIDIVYSAANTDGRK